MNLITVIRTVALACSLSLLGLSAWATPPSATVSLQSRYESLNSSVSTLQTSVDGLPGDCSTIASLLTQAEGYGRRAFTMLMDVGTAAEVPNRAQLRRNVTALKNRIGGIRERLMQLSAQCANNDIQNLIDGPANSPSCTNDSDCDDGEFCNGTETCDVDAGECVDGESPCASGEVCNEDTDTCERESNDSTDSLIGEFIDPGANGSSELDVLLAPDPPTPSTIRVSVILSVEIDKCQIKQPGVRDNPYFKKKKDSWGIRKVGFTTNKKSAWKIEDGSSRPVIVAVIDTGLDWNHKDFSKRNIWQNPGEIPGNGKDDDGNGFIDDIIGWNFIANNNKPWDDDGHGTFVSGIIAANSNNKIGIAGINKGAKIMVLKALNAFGHTRSSLVAEAIFYAAANGAKVINLSVGGKGMTSTEQDAINYAHKMGALVVMAAGNESVNTADYSSGLHHVISVASSDKKNKRAAFSNFGQQVDIAAPGMDIVSLRARRTDLMASVQGITYGIGDNYVGKDKRYFRASGTSFSAPIVAGAASLIMAKYPKLSNVQVRNMLLNSTKDIETPGWDQLTGAGLLDAAAALKADPDYFTDARIGKIAPVNKNGKLVVEVHGSSLSSDFRDAWLELGFGKKPRKWKKVSKSIRQGISSGRLAVFDVKNITRKGTWTVRLVVKTGKHGKREARASIDID